jgi:hypothetical protein
MEENIMITEEIIMQKFQNQYFRYCVTKFVSFLSFGSAKMANSFTFK